jgi:hypothetical protein
MAAACPLRRWGRPPTFIEERGAAGLQPLKENGDMRAMLIVVAAVALASCGVKPDPPPQVSPSAYGGMGAEMAKCMEYASQSYCEEQLTGGRAR